MGSYLIPNAISTKEAAAYIPFAPNRQWTSVDGGVLFQDPARTDAECAALYSGFVPSGVTDDQFQWPLPSEVRTHLQHLRDYQAADPSTITNAMTIHVVKDIIAALFYLNKRFEIEG